MRRILAIFSRDIKNSFRDYLVLYMIIAPFLLAIGLNFFIPSAQSASLQFALNEKVGEKIISEFERYGEVQVYPTDEEVKERVNDIDDVAGITKNEKGNFQLILEGNESHDTEVIPQMIIRDILSEQKVDVEYKISDIGAKGSPIAIIGSISVIMMAVLIGGVVIGFNIIEEKEVNTIMAMNVTPMTKLEFIIGRSIIGIIIPIIQVYGILWILGMLDVNKSMILVMTLVSSLIGLLIGFFMGVISSNQISGIANMKGIFIVVSLAIVGAILLPESKHFILYWIPTYWSFMGFKGILLNTITWNQLFIYIGSILGLNFIILLLLKGKIRKGLV